MTNWTASFMGGKQAGCIGLLSLYAAGFTPTAVVAYDELVKQLSETLGIPVTSSIHDSSFQESLSRSHILVSVHGRQIVPEKYLTLPSLGGINVHPCLYRYKGADPVGRLLEEGNNRASVGVHRMTTVLDEGEVLAEEFVMVDGKETVEAVYNALYPFYATALVKSLKIMQERIQTTE